jgi:hypothetical protein
LQLVWSYAPFVFRRGEDADFIFDLWTKAGGDFPALIQAITSPLFGLALIAGGVGYAIFAKEPEKPVAPYVPKIAWAIIGFCGVVLGTAFLFEQFLRESHVGEYVAQLTKERHVTKAQADKLKEILGPVSGNFPQKHSSVDVMAADNSESRGYAAELMVALTFAGLRISSANPRMPTPLEMHAIGNVKGVFIQVADVNKPPPEAVLLADALNKADIKTTFWNNDQFWIDNYILTVGLR